MFFRGDQYRYKISPDQVKDRVTAMEDYLQSIAETPPAGIGLLLISKLKIPTFHWPFSQRKQSMFTFALAFCSGYWYFSLHFQALCTLCRKRKRNLEERIDNENNWPQLSQVSGIECHIDRFAAYFFVFSNRKCISKSWGKLMSCKPWFTWFIFCHFLMPMGGQKLAISPGKIHGKNNPTERVIPKNNGRSPKPLKMVLFLCRAKCGDTEVS